MFAGDDRVGMIRVDASSSPTSAGYVEAARLNVDIIESYESIHSCLRVCVMARPMIDRLSA
jgi:hypothetical protein